VVFDIDGVLADVRHRLHHLEHRPKDWAGFFGAMSTDPPLPTGVAMVGECLAQGHQVVYLTGRNETYRRQTREWLDDQQLPAGRLMMRPDRDRRPARLFKPAALLEIVDDVDVLLVVDDDAAVVAELRAAGWPVQHATWMTESVQQQQTLFDAQESEGRS
jgi:hypothetical protein